LTRLDESNSSVGLGNNRLFERTSTVNKRSLGENGRERRRRRAREIDRNERDREREERRKGQERGGEIEKKGKE
jgi:hypothetical protein